MFTLVVLASSTVLVAVQLASAQLTPRIIALIYRNPIRKLRSFRNREPAKRATDLAVYQD